MKNKLAFVLALLLLCGLFTACGDGNGGSGGSGSVDVGACITVTFGGSEGEGTATAALDGEALARALEPDAEDMDILVTAIALEQLFSITVDKAEGLSNGDKVTVTAATSKDTAKELGLKTETATATFTVEGLGSFAEGPVMDVALLDDAFIGLVVAHGAQRLEELMDESYFSTWGNLDRVFVTQHTPLQPEKMYLTIDENEYTENRAAFVVIYSSDVSIREGYDEDEPDEAVGTRYFTIKINRPTYTVDEGLQLDWDAVTPNREGPFESLEEAFENAVQIFGGDGRPWYEYYIPYEVPLA